MATMYGTDARVKKTLFDLKQRGAPVIRYAGHEAVEVDLKYLKRTLASGSFIGKRLRPWHTTPPQERLDPNKVWVGVEMETGYPSTDGRREVMQWLNKNFVGRAAVDCEGSGRAPVEITFSPVHLEDLEWDSGIAQLIRHGKKNRPVNHNPVSLVGTHINISTPQMRRTGRFPIPTRNFYSALELMTGDEKEVLFGRSRVYGSQPGSLTSTAGAYVEFKWFNTTYDLRVWKGYCLVANTLAEMFLAAEERGIAPDSTEIKRTLVALIPKIKELHALKSGYSRRPSKTKGEKIACVLQ